MIARITGALIELNTDKNTVMLDVGDIAYEVMVPGYAVSDLSQQINRTITLYCLQYLEGTTAGGNLIPRLIGFPQPHDKTFFERFISVKGIGARKALRALSRPLADIAYCIENGDDKMLATLPEVGKRTAQQIIAELKGKMKDFALAATHTAGAAKKPLNEIEVEALEVLMQLGERRSEAEELLTRVREAKEDIKTTDALVHAFYRFKTGAPP